MPIRILLRLFFLAGLAAPWCAFALGVGQLEVRSALNQVFEAELPLIINNPTELTGLTARIPRQEEFNRAGVERLEFFSKLRFSVQTPPSGPKSIKITSLEPIREPNFTLLLELAWQRGRLIREFAIQLDPELYANRRQPPAPPPVVAPLPPVVAAPSVAPPPPAVPQLPPAPPVSFEGASFYGPVRSGETLAAIANRIRPSAAISVPQMMAILIAGNPTAFVDGNPNTLRSGTTLKVPTAQALGAPSAPPSPPSPAGPAVASAPTDLTVSGPTTISTPGSASPSEPVAPVTPPPRPITTTPLPPPAPVAEVAPPPTTPVPVTGPDSTPPSLPPAEPLREIVPQSTVPRSETPPAPPVVAPPVVAPPAAAPSVVAPPAAAPQPPAPAPKPKPPAAPPVAESSWMSNPIVWIAIALIVLAVAALIVLPLLRRPARTTSSTEEELAVLESTETLPTVVRSQEGTTARTRPREPVSVRPRPAVKLAAAPPATSAQEKAAPSLAGPATPRPIRELLKDDFGLGEGGAASAARPGAAPRDIKAPLLEAEPPTASVTRQLVSPLMEQEQQREAPVQPPTELPSELRLDGLDFDLDGLGLGKTARPQPSELPPLEMKPGSLGTGKPSGSSPLERGIAEPPTESSSPAPTVDVPTGSPTPGLKFEFADVTQELARSSTAEEPLKLDEALQNLGGDTLKLGDKTGAAGRVDRGMSAADYVETKLDLASAYLEMGDQVGARSLLDEVLREGDANQKERAKAFFKKLG